MRYLILSAAALLAVPAAAFAQDSAETAPLGEMAESMNDPARQAEIALTLQALGEIVLDMPVGPMMEAMAEAGADAAGKQARKIDPDTTLRKLAPEAGQMPRKLAEMTPQMMRAMGAAAKGMDKMAPALRDMAKRMEQALPAPRD